MWLKSRLLLFLCFFLAFEIKAQENCQLTAAQAPAVFNLSLGMTPREAQSVAGKNLKIKVKKEGTFFQNFIEKPPPAFLRGVRAVYLRFYNSRLYQIEVFYEAEEGSADLDEFVRLITAKFNLPENTWTKSFGKYEMNCDGFQIIADNVLNPRIELTETALFEAFEKSQKRGDK